MSGVSGLKRLFIKQEKEYIITFLGDGDLKTLYEKGREDKAGSVRHTDRSWKGERAAGR